MDKFDRLETMWDDYTTESVMTRVHTRHKLRELTNYKIKFFSRNFDSKTMRALMTTAVVGGCIMLVGEPDDKD